MKLHQKTGLMVAGLAASSWFAMPRPASAATIYSDSFSRTAPLNGSTPDTTTAAHTWTASTGLATNGSQLTSSGNTYGSASLPINGSSGITLDGSQSFVLSADVWATAGEVHLLLSNSTAPGSGDSSANLANWYLDSGHAQVRQRGVWKGSAGAYTTSSGQTLNLELAYDAATHKITYQVNGIAAINSSNPMTVTDADVQALRTVAFNFYSATAGLDNFTLTIVPEPATLAMIGVGGWLIGLRRGSKKGK